MTSAKFLKNNYRCYDLRRSFLKNLMFAVIAAAAMLIEPLSAALDYMFGYRMDEYDMNYYINSGMNEIFYFGIMICGAIMALNAFDFLMSVKKSNVYLSMGINRRKLFTNRIVSSVILLVTAVAVPAIVKIIVDSMFVGYSSALLTEAAVSSLWYLTAAAFGFAIVLTAVMICGNLIEAVLVTGFLAFIPYIILGITTIIADGYMRGSDLDMYNFAVLSPFTIIYTPENGCQVFQYIDAAQKMTKVGFINILPSLIWLIISVLIISGSYFIFKKRKMENNATALQSSAAKCIYSVFLAFCAVIIIALYFKSNNYSISAAYWLSLAASAVIFAAAMLLLFRNMKRFIKYLPGCAAFALPLTAVVLICLNGGFGYTSYIPKAEEIKSCYISLPEITFDCLGSYSTTGSDGLTLLAMDTDPVSGPYTEKRDIDIVMNLHREIINNPADCNNSCVVVAYQLKDGSTVSREYKSVSENTLQDMLKVYQTDFMDGYIKGNLCGDKEIMNRYKNILEDDDSTINDFYTINRSVESWKYNLINSELGKLINRYKNDKTKLLLWPSDKSKAYDASEKLTYDNITELTNAIYIDYKASGYKNIQGTNVPCGILTFTSANYYDTEILDYDDSVLTLHEKYTSIYDYGTNYISLPVYSDMTNTINVLKKYGVYKYMKSDQTVEKVIVTNGLKDDNIFNYYFSRWYFQDYVPEGVYNYREFDSVFTVLETVTDPDKIALLNSGRSFNTRVKKGMKVLMFECSDKSIYWGFMDEEKYNEIMGKN